MRQRPQYRDKATRYLAAQELLPEVHNWLRMRDDDGYTDEELRRSIMGAIEFHNDGYAVCQALERYEHWDPDAQLVEIMDGAGHALWNALSRREKSWVAKTDLRPVFAVGSRVEFETHHNPRMGKAATRRGVITRVHADEGKYVVFCAELGHVRHGEGCHGIYVNVEDARVATGPTVGEVFAGTEAGGAE